MLARLATCGLLFCVLLPGCGSSSGSANAGAGRGGVSASGGGSAGSAAVTQMTPDQAAEARELVGKLVRGEKTMADLSPQQQRLVAGVVALDREREARKR